MLIPYQTCANAIKALHSVVPTKVIHIGAHVGEEAAFYQDEGVKEVIWFEANRELLGELEENTRKFRLKQQIIPLALWDKNTELQFNITNNLQSSSFLGLGTHREHYPDIVVERLETVSAYRLDSLISSVPGFLSFSDFDFINIDTQGAELHILKGMGDYVFQESVKGVYLEVNTEEVYKGAPSIAEIDSYLMRGGFYRMKTRVTTKGWGDALYIRQALI